MTTQYPEPQYALWSDPETSVSVVYSIQAFRDIEFACEDGFRKIPHGGLEVGGLLLGQVEDGSIYVEGIRTIDCEYARGPSFTLSDKDLAKLREQLAFLESDAAAEGQRPIGWFISHARSQLQMHPREVELFNDLFPGNAVTVLVRPGPVGPFPFSFFVRDPAGAIELDGTYNAVLLPRVEDGVSAGRDNPVPSPPAPIRETVPPRTKTVEAPSAPAAIDLEEEPEPLGLFEPEQIGKYEILDVEEASSVEAQPEAAIEDVEEAIAPPVYEQEPIAPEPFIEQEPEAQRARMLAANEEPEPLTLGRELDIEPVLRDSLIEQPVEPEETRPVEQPEALVADSEVAAVDEAPPVVKEPIVEEPILIEEPAVVAQPPVAGKPSINEEPKPLEPEVLGPAPVKSKPPKSGKWTKRAAAVDAAAAAVPTSTALAEIPPPPPVSAKPEPRVHEVPEEPADDDKTSADVFNTFWARPSLAARLRNSRLTVAAILILAAVFGSAIGYWAYSRLPSATIPLHVDTQSSDLVITWSPAETRDSSYAALRIDNSDPQPLSDADKAAGKTQLKIPADNVKIELIARHWMRDSRGIVRYINGVSSAPELPSGATIQPVPGSSTKKRR